MEINELISHNLTTTLDKDVGDNVIYSYQDILFFNVQKFNTQFIFSTKSKAI